MRPASRRAGGTRTDVRVRSRSDFPRHARPLRRTSASVSRCDARSRRPPEHRRAVVEHRRRAAVHDPRLRLRSRPRSVRLQRARSRGDRPRRLSTLRRDGARSERLRGLASGFPAARAARRVLPRHLRQRVALPRAFGRVAARARRASDGAPATRRSLRVESARSQRGRLESRPLRQLSRSADMVALPGAGRVHADRSLLSSGRAAARAAALARHRRASRFTARGGIVNASAGPIRRMRRSDRATTDTRSCCSTAGSCGRCSSRCRPA